MYSQLDNFVKTQKHLYDNQYGFRTEHSTKFAALELADRVITCMDHNETPIHIYLDLSKAFDTLDHKILLAKLQYYGIRGTIRIKSSNRRHKIKNARYINMCAPGFNSRPIIVHHIMSMTLPCLARRSNL